MDAQHEITQTEILLLLFLLNNHNPTILQQVEQSILTRLVGTCVEMFTYIM